MLLFPAIDLYEGKAVRLFKGRYDEMTVYSEDPGSIGEDFARCGASHIHIVDLEGAKEGTTPNFETVLDIQRRSGCFCEIGGGIRSMEVVRRYLDAGIDRVILGTAAVTDPDFAAQAAGIYAAVDEYHCDILNISAGDPDIVPEVQSAIQHALDEGVIVIAAAGNSGDNQLLYPASYDGVISVSSVDKDLVLSATSNRNDHVFVAAPGVGVSSLGRLPGTVTLSSGTSFAAPVVAGVAALLKEAWPQMTANDFREILKNSCKDLSTKGYDIYYGWGLVQAPDAIRAAAEYFGDEAPDMSAPDNPGSAWSDFFSFNWLREFFQNIIRNLFKGWNLNFSL